ncbi:MAG: sulfite exporter TauE/SafE family protein [Porticoccaceae bacterium]
MTYLIGFCIGAILGLTGAGGSVVALPLLVGPLELPVPVAAGMALGAVAVAAATGLLARLRSGDIVWMPGLFFAAVATATLPLGSYLNRLLPEMLLLALFAILVLYVAIRLWRQATYQPDDAAVVRAHGRNAETRQPVCRFTQGKPGYRCFMQLALAALVAGVLSGLFGVGGGFVIVPVLIFLTGISVHQAVATSLLVITLVAGSGFGLFLLDHDGTSLELLLPLAIGGALGMLAGTWLARYMAGPILQKTFAVVMVLLANGVLLQALLKG